MITGILSDAHGNLPVFEQCLAFLEARCERVIFLGDAFGYMPEGNEVLDIIMKRNITMLPGNHDAMVAGLLDIDEKKNEVYKLDAQIAKLSGLRKDFIRSLPTEMTIRENSTSIYLVHASPWDHLQGYIYEKDVDDRFNNLPYDFLLMAHTHRPFQIKRGKMLIANAGSCGMPRDIGNLACVNIFNSITQELEQVRLPFDENEVIERYRGQIHPDVINCLKRK